ncbi:hypothetical protein PPERSA_05328 [Pseudocohnilembus persalinus]|uniref:VWFA domain-containing protein n=1 Tax=Pseudocohnilembus persalinus TaxID=266149 RepID=A0A0V0R6E7_PSEPJ|nr:hypothetical protein PPERSA_05328 [Pseudocohnilembus persalinus]|eukprot:KRX09936.1 hypothetical protein PPERSA_05328 [Pseudocohnilembus persalinus]
MSKQCSLPAQQFPTEDINNITTQQTQNTFHFFPSTFQNIQTKNKITNNNSNKYIDHESEEKNTDNNENNENSDNSRTNSENKQLQQELLEQKQIQGQLDYLQNKNIISDINQQSNSSFGQQSQNTLQQKKNESLFSEEWEKWKGQNKLEINKNYKVFKVPKISNSNQNQTIIGVIDSSSSMQNCYKHMANEWNSKILPFCPQSRCIVFSDQTQIQTKLQDSPEMGTTEVEKAFIALNQQLQQPDVQNQVTIIFISDGCDNQDQTIIQRLEKLKSTIPQNKQINFITIGIGLEFPTKMAIKLRMMYHNVDNNTPPVFLLRNQREKDNWNVTFKIIKKFLVINKEIKLDDNVQQFPWSKSQQQIFENSFVFSSDNNLEYIHYENKPIKFLEKLTKQEVVDISRILLTEIQLQNISQNKENCSTDQINVLAIGALGAGFGLYWLSKNYGESVFGKIGAQEYKKALSQIEDKITLVISENQKINDLATQKTEQCNQLEDQINQLIKENDNINELLKAKTQEQNQKIEQEKQKYQELEIQLEKSNSEKQQNHLQMETLKTDLLTLQQKITEENNNYQLHIKQLKEINEKLEEKNLELESKITEDYSHTQNKNSEIELKLIEALQENEKIMNHLESCQNSLETVQNENKILIEENQNLHDQILGQNQKNQNHQKSHETHQSQQSQNSQGNESIYSQSQKKENLSQNQSQIENLENENLKLNENIIQLQNEKQHLLSLLQNIKSSVLENLQQI